MERNDNEVPESFLAPALNGIQEENGSEDGNDPEMTHTGVDENQDPNAQSEMRKKELAREETRMLGRMRLLLGLVLISSAIVVSVVIYVYLRNEETKDFEKDILSDVTKVKDGIGGSLDDTLGAVDAYISKMVAQTHEEETVLLMDPELPNQTKYESRFPFVTVPGFGVQAAKMMKLSKALHFVTCYFVTPEDRPAWDAYSVEHSGWVNDTIRVQNNNEEWYGETLKDFIQVPTILHFDETGVVPAGDPYPVMDPPNYLVSWQRAPLVQEYNYIPYNWDLWVSPLRRAMAMSAITHSVIITQSQNVLYNESDPRQVERYEQEGESSKNYLPPDQTHSYEPLTTIMYPILDVMDTVRVDVSQDDIQAVGVVVFVIYWRELLVDILPANSIGLVVVIESTCGDLFTYQLDGEKAIYLGPGDLHDPAYDEYKQEAKFVDIMDTAKSERGSSYTGLPLNDEFCSQSIRIYPSKDKEEKYTTNNPVIMSVSAAMIFVLTSLIFVLYDCLVTRRQRIVANVAAASTDIVHNLFPEQVAQQLYEERQQQQNKETNLKSFLASGDVGDRSSAPIASEYENTTILFADLAGFTKWSSMHSPQEVFQMLETFYGAFDAIAKRRRVFKVETIGDCYVAVTGIPDPQVDHATIMCRFATDCLNAVNELKVQLSETLGPGTVELKFRVGMHSGSVTAGVLRGDKGRFQLFGDAMNTASRMESNGVPDRIHVSQATADALIARGKASWITPREDKILAKGKGEMQTYFVVVKSRAQSTSSFTTISSSPSFEAPVKEPMGLGGGSDDAANATTKEEQKALQDSFVSV